MGSHHHHGIILHLPSSGHRLSVITIKTLREMWVLGSAKDDLYFQSIQFWSEFISVNEGGRIYLTLTAISPTPALHLARFKASSSSEPTLLLCFSTCVFHIFCGCPCFLLLFTSNSKCFFQNMPIIPLKHMPVPSHSIHLWKRWKMTNEKVIIFNWFILLWPIPPRWMKIGIKLVKRKMEMKEWKHK